MCALAQAKMPALPSGTAVGPSVDQLRPMLARARVCLQRAVFEPAWLSPACCTQQLAAWQEVLMAAEQLVTM